MRLEGIEAAGNNDKEKKKSMRRNTWHRKNGQRKLMGIFGESVGGRKKVTIGEEERDEWKERTRTNKGKGKRMTTNGRTTPQKMRKKEGAFYQRSPGIEPDVGVEPTTLRLRVSRSTD